MNNFIKNLNKFIFASAASFLASQSALAAEPDYVYVQVRESKLHAKPEFLSAQTAGVRYADKLERLSDEGNWIKVKTAGGAQGYVHVSALSKRRIVLASDKSFTGGKADSSDITLAGKGFGKDVEKSLAAGNAALNYKEVDRMERLRVSSSEVASFAKSGKLSKEG